MTKTERRKRRAYYLANREKLIAGVKARQADRIARIPWVAILEQARYRAKAKNVSYALSSKWAEARWTGKCEMTGLPFKSPGGPMHPFAASLDRMDPQKGYTEDNCRFILLGVNMLKGTGTEEDAINIARALIALADL